MPLSPPAAKTIFSPIFKTNTTVLHGMLPNNGSMSYPRSGASGMDIPRLAMWLRLPF
jgi:hypothetical protein